jgi:hypothetical protein
MNTKKRFYSQFVETGIYAVRDRKTNLLVSIFANTKGARRMAKDLNDREKFVCDMQQIQKQIEAAE